MDVVYFRVFVSEMCFKKFGQPSHASGRLSVSRSFELFKVASRPVFDKKSDFLLRHRYGKTTASIKTSGLHCPDAILDKARRGEEMQPSGRQGNTVWTPILIMEIKCSKSATVRTLGHTVRTQP